MTIKKINDIFNNLNIFAPYNLLNKSMTTKKALKVNSEIDKMNIHELFVEYSTVYFDAVLHNSAVLVEWSKRMTLCAGVTYLYTKGNCIIRLSKSILKYRSIKELQETLLHEMIHAYLFLCKKQTYADYTNGGHGPVFICQVTKHRHF